MGAFTTGTGPGAGAGAGAGLFSCWVRAAICRRMSSMAVAIAAGSIGFSGVGAGFLWGNLACTAAILAAGVLGTVVRVVWYTAVSSSSESEAGWN